MGTLYNQAFDQSHEKPSLINKEINGAQTNQNHLIEVAVSFLPHPVKPEHGTVRSKRAMGLLGAATRADGLILGNPVKDAAFSALSIFILCADNKEQKAIVEYVMATYKHFQAIFEKVQRKNDDRFYNLQT